MYNGNKEMAILPELQQFLGHVIVRMRKDPRSSPTCWQRGISAVAPTFSRFVPRDSKIVIDRRYLQCAVVSAEDCSKAWIEALELGDRDANVPFMFCSATISEQDCACRGQLAGRRR